MKEQIQSLIETLQEIRTKYEGLINSVSQEIDQKKIEHKENLTGMQEDFKKSKNQIKQGWGSAVDFQSLIHLRAKPYAKE